MRLPQVVRLQQRQVARYYYELRKGLFDFDAVLAAQREKTYRERDVTLRSEPAGMMAMMGDMCDGVVGDIVDANWAKGGAAPSDAADGALAATLVAKLAAFFPSIALEASTLEGLARDDARAAAARSARAALEEKAAALDAACRASRGVGAT